MRRLLAPCGALLALAILAGACTRRTPTPDTSAARAQALIDAGNTAFERGDYDGAAKRYASAAVVSPGDPAAFYGLGMALAKLGRDDDARRAYAKARELARDSALAR
jgi:Flp pilus assembly protein TadD